MEFGQVFQKSLTMSEATRSGARLGAAQPRQDGYQDDVALAVQETLKNTAGDSMEYLSVYRAHPDTGDPWHGSDPESCTDDCFRYVWDATNDTWVLDSDSPDWPALEQFACGDTTDTDYLGVYVRGQHRMSTSILPGSISLSERTVMRLEPLPLADTCKPG